MLISVQTFNNLFHGFPAGFAKISDLALLNGMFHAAKHPLVPEGTPVPGFERPTLHQMTSQDIASGKKVRFFFVNIFTYLSIKTFARESGKNDALSSNVLCLFCFVLFLSSRIHGRAIIHGRSK